MSNGENSNTEYGSYIIIDGKRREMLRHPTDFSVDASRPEVQSLLPRLGGKNVRQLSIGMSRVEASEPTRIDETMKTVRETNVAHHIYKLADTGEDIVIADRVFLRAEEVDPADRDAIIAHYRLIFAILKENKLILEEEMGSTYTLKVTTDSGRNPLKIANEIATRKGVVSCVPEILLGIKFVSLCGNAPTVGVNEATDQHTLFTDQWHLISINVIEAWEKHGYGKPEIVIAVIDDGFDLPLGAKPNARHPAFTGTIVDTEHMRNYDLSIPEQVGITKERNIASQGGDNHGTCVASIIAASHGSMMGVAPCCTILPIRIGGISVLKPADLLKALSEVSQFADVVNCSFSLEPSSVGIVDPTFKPGIEKLIGSGGRRPGDKGLIIVFAAGNDNAPIRMTEEQNKNGIDFLRGAEKVTLGPNNPIHCGFTEVDGVVVVGAMTSIKRKAGYSNWGPELTVVAPSDNGHELTEVEMKISNPDLKRTDPAFQDRFPGLGIVSAVNRASHGSPLDKDRPIEDSTIATANGLLENPCTRSFGGTSAAAAIVSGVIGLMLSVNANLTREQVIKILIDTAEHGNEKVNPEKLVDLDADDDRNLIGVDGAFNPNNHSVFFGAGKVDAANAVDAAKVKTV